MLNFVNTNVSFIHLLISSTLGIKICLSQYLIYLMLWIIYNTKAVKPFKQEFHKLHYVKMNK